MNTLKALQEYGQSVWLDFISRDLITTGELRRRIKDDGLRGVTSNPAIFERAVAGSRDYNDQLKELESREGLEPMARYEQLAIRDIQDAADIMRAVYDATKTRDGYISLEVSPYLANDTRATIEEARRLWKKVGRPNLMIKVPGTEAGLPAIERLIGEGINVNVTLLFAQERYEQVAAGYLAGVRALAKAGGDVARIASVASFFVSRIDTLVDRIIDRRLAAGPSAGEKAMLEKFKGKVAVANARLAYQKYQTIYKSEPWQALARAGAHTQRLLWASTSTRNPAYRDIMYVEELIGPDTVNTIPPATMNAFRDHGRPRASLEANLEEAHDAMDTLARAGISMKEVTDQLVEEGVRLFAEAFDKLLAAVDKGRQSQLKTDDRSAANYC